MKKKRQRNSEYMIVMLLAVAVAAVVVIMAMASPSKSPPDTAANVTDAMTTEAHTGTVTDTVDTDYAAASADADAFRISDVDTLDLLLSGDAFGEYRRESGEDPLVVLEDTVTLDHDVTFTDGICLMIEGKLGGAGKLRFRADGECTIDIRGDENISRFDIDAPRASLYMTGGDVPYLYEVAESQNVAYYNGTSTVGGADGDTLGGAGRARIADVALYENKKRESVRDDAYSTVVGNIITLYVPHDVSDKDMKSLYISADIDGDGVCDTSTPLDLSSPALLTVTDSVGAQRVYRIMAMRARLDIPILCLYTDDGSDIDSKETYKTGYMTLDGEKYTLSVKGRGNASWNTFPKHSYRIKLDSKAKLCSMKADRDWCLIGNYADMSLLRNIVASEMALYMDGMPYTPSYRSVDLFINGEYAGVFMLSEKIEDDEDRVPLGERVTDEDGKIKDMGFLIEFGWDYSSENVWAKDYFDTTYCKRMYIKEPEITEAKNAEYKYIYNYVKAAENAIVKGEGYEDYIDVDSWVDWFIVNELTYNSECAFYRSLYMYKPVGGKLTAGPIWDYDMAFGNNLTDKDDYTGWCSVDYVSEWMYDNWMKFLTKDESFMSRVRARWDEKKDGLMQVAVDALSRGAGEIERSQVYNFKLWNKALRYQIGISRASTLGMRTWQEHVEYVDDFLQKRYATIDSMLAE